MKKHNPLNFIVLDDVITSVDLTHKDKIARLIISEFKNYTILVTTHNPLWAEQLQRICEGYGRNNEILQITNWELGIGPNIKKHKKTPENINEYLEKDEYNAAANNSAIKRFEPKKSDYYKKTKDPITNKMVPVLDSNKNKIFNEKAYKNAYNRYVQKYLATEKAAYEKALNEYNALAQKIDSAKKVNATASKVNISEIEKNIEQHMDIIIALAYRSKDFKDMKQNAQVRNAARTI